jgi:beta-glucosidase
MNQPRFPDGFLWGAATSSHQVEGDDEWSDWAAWERQPGRIRDGTTAGRAAEWWRGRAEEDLARAADLGHNAHRLSLEWSRLEPRPGQFDEAAFERYATILDRARALGLTPVVTLNHFTLPRWASREGSWANPTLPGRFVAFARRVASRLGSRIDLWATLNEPNVLAYMGYAGTHWPPGHGKTHLAFRALGHMLAAHAGAYHAIREIKPESRVGIVLNLPVFDPARRNPLDRSITAAHRWGFEGVLMRALEDGRLRLPLTVAGKRVPGLARSFDWLGINYYGRYAVRFDPRSADPPMARHVQAPTVRTEWNDWGQPYPQGLRRQLHALSTYGVPLYVTENGLYDNDDSRRPQFLLDHIHAVGQAIESGVDVRGYFHWSLIDNFEWAEGWSTHFGLLALDRETQTRTPRRSAEVYADICRRNGG